MREIFPRVKEGDAIILTDAYLIPIVVTVIRRTPFTLICKGLATRITASTSYMVLPYSEKLLSELESIRKAVEQQREAYINVASNSQYKVYEE